MQILESSKKSYECAFAAYGSSNKNKLRLYIEYRISIILETKKANQNESKLMIQKANAIVDLLKTNKLTLINLQNEKLV